ncbi:hypothetical protein C8F01DRAFT_1090973 [Mycena amicta]|nr:hypothetical protein C8F01DRAFT_1090973 [Mycena amicta]
MYSACRKKKRVAQGNAAQWRSGFTSVFGQMVKKTSTVPSDTGTRATIVVALPEPQPMEGLSQEFRPRGLYKTFPGWNENHWHFDGEHASAQECNGESGTARQPWECVLCVSPFSDGPGKGHVKLVTFESSYTCHGYIFNHAVVFVLTPSILPPISSFAVFKEFTINVIVASRSHTAQQALHPQHRPPDLDKCATEAIVPSDVLPVVIGFDRRTWGYEESYPADCPCLSRQSDASCTSTIPSALRLGPRTSAMRIAHQAPMRAYRISLPPPLDSFDQHHASPPAAVPVGYALLFGGSAGGFMSITLVDVQLNSLIPSTPGYLLPCRFFSVIVRPQDVINNVEHTLRQCVGPEGSLQTDGSEIYTTSWGTFQADSSSITAQNRKFRRANEGRAYPHCPRSATTFHTASELLVWGHQNERKFSL